MTNEERWRVANIKSILEAMSVDLSPDAEAVATALRVAAANIHKFLSEPERPKPLTRWRRFVAWLTRHQSPVGLRRCGCGGVYESPLDVPCCPTCNARDFEAQALRGDKD